MKQIVRLFKKAWRVVQLGTEKQKKGGIELEISHPKIFAHVNSQNCVIEISETLANSSQLAVKNGAGLAYQIDSRALEAL